MKKRNLSIVAVIVVVLALLGGGAWMLFGRSTAETGNRLDIAWYDVNQTEFTITSTEQLYEFAQLSKYYDFKGQTFKLGADIVVNEGNAAEWLEKAPERKWIPISGFAGVFDGQGHSISGLYGTGFDTAMAVFTNTSEDCQIRNFKLVNSCFKTSGYGGTASIVSNGGGTFEKLYSDAILKSDDYVGGLFSKTNRSSVLSECWFDGSIAISGRTAGGITDAILGSRVTMKHCLFTGSIEGTWLQSGSRIGGLCGMVNETGAMLVLNDSLSAGTVKPGNIYYTGSIVGVLFSGTAMTTVDSYVSMSTYDALIGRSGSKGTLTGAPLGLREQELTGINGYKWTTLDFENYWSVEEDSTPVLKCFSEKPVDVKGVEKAFDIAWYNENEFSYKITNLKELYGMYILSASNDFAGKIISLENDIVVNEGTMEDWLKEEPGNPWYPIEKFGGTFDGKGHSVSGIYYNASAEGVGFFKNTIFGSNVKNFKLTNSYFCNTTTASATMGSIAGTGNGNFESVYSDAVLVSTGTVVGGLVGFINDSSSHKISNCWFDGKISMKGELARYCGGITGNVVKGSTTIEHCLNTGEITCDYDDGGLFVGGISSVVMNQGTNLVIKDCLSVGTITTTYDYCVGTVLGRIPDGPKVNIKDTYSATESYSHPTRGPLGIGYKSTEDYKGGVVNYYKSDISGYGGYQRTTLDFEKYWAVDLKGTPVLKAFASSTPSVAGVKKLVDISWYDEEKDTYVIDSMQDLNGLYIVSALTDFEGKTVKLGADITVNTGNAADWANKAPAYGWYPIKTFKGTFEGNGKTISGIYMNADYSYSGLFAMTAEKAKIQNLRLVNSYFKSTAEDACMGSISGRGSGTFSTIYSNAILESTGKQIGGLFGNMYCDTDKYKAVHTITNCWFDGKINATSEQLTQRYIGGMTGVLMQGTLNISHCLNTGDITYTHSIPDTKNPDAQVAGLVGGQSGSNRPASHEKGEMISVITISDSLNEGRVLIQDKTGKEHKNGVAAILGYSKAGIIKLNNVYATAESHARGIHHPSGNAKNVTGSVVRISEDAIKGLNGYNYTELDFAKYWAARSAAVPALKSFVGAGLDTSKTWKLDTSWYDASKSEFVLTTKNQLFGFASLVNTGTNFEGKTVKLGADISVNTGESSAWGTNPPADIWTPIGTGTSSAFKGTFDGNGKTISGIYINGGATEYVALFGYTNGATIKNLRLTNSYITSTAQGVGSVVAYASNGITLENVYSNATLVVSNKVIGGLVAQVQNTAKDSSSIKNSCYAGTIIQSNLVEKNAMGGFVGTATHGTLTVTNGLFVGTMDCTYKGSATSIVAHVGGIIGNTQGNNVLLISNTLGAGILDKNGSTVTLNGTGSVAGYLNSSTYTNVINKDNVYGISSFHSKVLGGYVSSKNGLEQRSTNTEATVDGAKDTILEKLNGTQETAYWVINGSPEEDRYTVLLDTFKDMFVYSEYVKEEVEELPYDISWLDDAVNNGSSADTPYLLSDVKDLLGFAYLVNRSEEPMNFAGKYIKLTADINVNPEWTAGATAPTTVWTPIGNATTKFAGTFDGNGKTISGIYVNGQSTSYIALFAYTSGATIQNLRLTNSYFTSTKDGVGSIVAYADAGITLENVYSDATLAVSGKTIGGLIAQVQNTSSTVATIKNSCYAGEITHSSIGANMAIGGFVGTATNGQLVVQNGLYVGEMNCTYTGTTTPINGRIGGICGVTQGTNVLNITHTLGAGVLNVTCTQINSLGLNATGSIVGYVNASTKTGIVSTANVYGVSTFHSKPVGGMKSGAGLAQRSTNTVTTVTESADALLTALNDGQEKTYWIKKDSANVDRYTVILKEFENMINALDAEQAAYDISWLDDAVNNGSSADTPYILSDAKDLLGLAYLVNRSEEPMNFAGKYIKLAADIDVNPEWKAGATAPTTVWTPIGNATTKFAGTFDGNSKSISGIYVDGKTTEYNALFAYTDGATIKNLRLTNSYFTSSANGLASIVAYANGGITLDNVYSDATIITSGKTIGGLIALAQNTSSSVATIKNSCYAGTITHSNLVASTAMGGFVGTATNGQLVVQNGLYVGEMNCTYSGTAASIDARVGGICGVTQGTNVLNITNTLGAGVLNVTHDNVDSFTMNGTGSILGYMNAKTKTGIVSTTSVYGVSTFHSKPVGAIRSSYSLAERSTKTVASVETSSDTLLAALNGGQETTYWVKNEDTSVDRYKVVLGEFKSYFVDKQTENISLFGMLSKRIDTLAESF